MSRKNLKHLKSFRNNDDQDRLNLLYDDIKYLSLDLTDNKIENNLWISNNWDVKRGKRGTYKVNINLSITDMSNDLIDVLKLFTNSDIRNAEWFRDYSGVRLPNLSKFKRKILFDFFESLKDYVSYNNGEISTSTKIVDGFGYNDDPSFYIIIIMDFGIESTTKLSSN